MAKKLKVSTALTTVPPLDMTVDEVAMFRRESRSTVERKMRAGVYRSYLSGRDKRLVTRESVLADREACLAAGPRFDGGKRGRPRKVLESAAAAEGGPSKAPPEAERPTD